MDIPINFKPVRKAGSLRMDDYHIWGASPVFADGKYHLFASRWDKSVTMLHWATNSEVIRAESETPEGPYEFREVVLGQRDCAYGDCRVTHNPAILSHNGLFFLFYTGMTYSGDKPRNETIDQAMDEMWAESWNSKRIWAAVSDSVYGPWQRSGKPVLEVRPGKWDSVLTSNAAPCVTPDGRIMLIYKSADVVHENGPYRGRFHLGCAFADIADLKFERISDDPITLNDNLDTHIEDPFVWHDGEKYNMLIKDMTGELCGEEQAGVHAVSENGQQWYCEQSAAAYSRRFIWEDGTAAHQPKLERPQVLMTDGKPSHIFFATFDQDQRGEISNTRNLVFEID